MQSDDFTMDRDALKRFFKCSDAEVNIVSCELNIVKVFKYFDMVDSSTAIRYDLLSRAFRLRVDGRLAHDPGLYHQPGEWAAAAVTRDSRRLLAAS
mgnify:CR=1 FL=1